MIAKDGTKVKDGLWIIYAPSVDENVICGIINVSSEYKEEYDDTDYKVDFCNELYTLEELGKRYDFICRIDIDKLAKQALKGK